MTIEQTYPTPDTQEIERKTPRPLGDVVAQVSAKFLFAFPYIQSLCHKIAVSKGFWESDRGDGEAIALMHSELSELLEGVRHGNPPSDHIPEYSSAEEELADLFIRGMDLAEKRGWRVDQAIIAKMLFNANRPYKHGKAF
jgi:NTP pyrophosphatase (non-canonical NTP hydrolase)